MVIHTELKEARTLICKSIQYRLKDYIKGVVKVYPQKDFIVIEIYGVNDIAYKVAQKLSDSEIVRGFSSEGFAQNIVKWYKRYITNLFFCNKVVDK